MAVCFKRCFLFIIIWLNVLRMSFTDRIVDSIEANRTPVDGLSLRSILIDLNEAQNGNRLVTNLDNYRNLFILLRRLTFMMTYSNMDDLYRRNRRSGKMQNRFAATLDFPCDLTYGRSVQKPHSVHQLRPGDIDVVASIGDSLSAGNGVISENLIHIINEFRGISFAGGGLGDWRTFMTLPNILKAFNPKLYGYSTANSLTVDSSSKLNIAEPMIMSRDLPYQAAILIERMRHDPNIDMQRHWKLLTIFVGNNDICSDICHHNNMTLFVKRHEHDLRQTLTLLRDNVPRLLVNLVPAPNMVTTLFKSMRKISRTLNSCSAVHRVGCHCIFTAFSNPNKLSEISSYIAHWQNIEEYISQQPEYQTEDFVVLYQPFTANTTIPTLANGETDLRYFASDCFHFSQLGHASMANSLWNNMMQPVGRKQLNFEPAFKYFECPTEQQPFIHTLRNS